MGDEGLGHELQPSAGGDGKVLATLGVPRVHFEDAAGAGCGDEEVGAGGDGDGGLETVAGEHAGSRVDDLDNEHAGVGIPVGLAEVVGRAE